MKIPLGARPLVSLSEGCNVRSERTPFRFPPSNRRSYVNSNRISTAGAFVRSIARLSRCVISDWTGICFAISATSVAASCSEHATVPLEPSFVFLTAAAYQFSIARARARESRRGKFRKIQTRACVKNAFTQFSTSAELLRLAGSEKAAAGNCIVAVAATRAEPPVVAGTDKHEV